MVISVSYLWTLPLVIIAAGLLGATFPLMCHISVRADSKAGAGLSYLYISNIIGSAAGSWLVGFIMMDHFSLREISVMLALLGLAVSWVLFNTGKTPRLITAAVTIGVFAVIFFSSKPLFANIYGQMQFKEEWGLRGTGIETLIETRSGVITVDQDKAIYGGGVFDGYMSTKIDEDSTTSIVHPLSISYIHPNPKEILNIGLSGGAWTQVIANHPQVEKVTVIEINPGYVEVVRRYPAVSRLLTNPKVEIIIDDGRRWITNNRDRKFDMIVLDTIHHWRGHATNLLSTDFYDIARKALKPGGVIYYNSTYSRAAQHTGAVYFPYAVRFGMYLGVSDSPIQIDKERWSKVLHDYRLDGKLIFDPANENDQKLLNRILDNTNTILSSEYFTEGWETRDNILRRTEGKPIITDDNMVTEWRGETFK